jgi:hypothetical protein
MFCMFVENQIVPSPIRTTGRTAAAAAAALHAKHALLVLLPGDSIRLYLVFRISP